MREANAELNNDVVTHLLDIVQSLKRPVKDDDFSRQASVGDIVERGVVVDEPKAQYSASMYGIVWYCIVWYGMVFPGTYVSNTPSDYASNQPFKTSAR